MKTEVGISEFVCFSSVNEMAYFSLDQPIYRGPFSGPFSGPFDTLEGLGAHTRFELNQKAEYIK